MGKKKVAILGATGVVGQRFIQLLQNHPWFEIEAIAASERSSGKKYGKVANWTLESELPREISQMHVVDTNVKAIEKIGNIDIVFSSLPTSVAEKVEIEFAKEFPVFSKASAHRMEEDIPLIIPEVNPDHLGLIPIQKENRRQNGFISTDPNCSTIQLAMTLKPLMMFKLKKIIVTTMQALSGAGYPGVASLDIIDNVIPYIPNEEEKIEKETLKILGDLNGETICPADIAMSASCNRVNVKDGHLESVCVELEENPGLRELKKVFKNFKGEPQEYNLPSAPEYPIIIREELNRPQPRLDRESGGGMSVVIGRVREDPVLTFKYMCLGHNTVRGAAGAALLNAELAMKKGYLNN